MKPVLLIFILLFSVLWIAPMNTRAQHLENGRLMADVVTYKYNNWAINTGDTLYLRDSTPVKIWKMQRWERLGYDHILIISKEKSKKQIYDLVQCIEHGQIIAPAGTLVNPINRFDKFPKLTDDTLYLNDSVKIHEGAFVQLLSGSLPNGDYKWINEEVGRGNLLNGRSIKVIKLKKSGHRSVGFKYFAFLAGQDKVYSCDAENAYLSGEIAVNGKRLWAATATPTSVADELKKLKELKDQGILTDAEFEAQKQKLLNR